MEQLFIICVDDQTEVLNALEGDLEVFDDKMNVEVCSSAAEALALIDEIDADGDFVAVIISDQVMPKTSGVELLATVTDDPRFELTQKMLLTGQATHQDTIQAINLGGIDLYVEKPWNRQALIDKVKTLITRFILKKGIDYNNYMDLLDQEVLFAELRKST